MKKILVGLLVCILIISFSGCQETPEHDLVKNKREQDLELEMKIRQNEEGDDSKGLETLSSFPEYYQEKIEIDGLILDIEANFNISNTDRIISEKVKPGAFSIDTIREIMDYFVGDSICYPLGTVGSKEEVMDTIVSIKQQIAALENGSVLDINEGDGTTEEQLRILKEQLKEHEKLYADADDSEPISIETIDFDEKGAIEVQCNLGREEAARLLFYEDLDRGTRFEFINYIPAYNTVDKKQAVEISEKEAIQKASQVIQRWGLGNLEVMEVEKKSQIVDGAIVGFYDISYKRNVSGLQNIQLEQAATIQSDLVEPEAQEEYSARLGQMKENIQVDNTGIIGMNITSPPVVLECINDNVTILGLEQLKEHLKSGIANKSWKIPGEKTYLKITNIYLSTMYIVNKNNNEEYITVPVWDFCGYSYSENMPENSLYNLKKIDKESVYKTTYLTLNAVDGSIISRSSGY